MFARSTDNLVSGNIVSSNGFHKASNRRGDGIRVFRYADRNTVKDNQVFENAANGIRVDSQNNMIISNRTRDNATGVRPGDAAAFDLYDTNTAPACDANVWSHNTYETAFPKCTTEL